MRGARGSSSLRSASSVVCSESASAGLTRPTGSASSRSKARRSPTVEKTRFLCPIPPARAEQFDRVEHLLQVVRRLAHAHQDHLADGAQAARERHLGDDLGRVELAQQAAATGHAEDATDGTAELGRDAYAVARQQHALDQLAIGQAHQQPFGSIRIGVARVQGGQRGKLLFELGQQRAHASRHEVIEPTPAGILRQGIAPQPQHALQVLGFGTGRDQPRLDCRQTDRHHG